MPKDTQEWTCHRCGEPCSRKAVKGQRPKWCGPDCAWRAAEERRRALSVESSCEMCGQPLGYGRRFCSVVCIGKSKTKHAPPRETKPVCAPMDQRHPVRKALESGDMAQLRDALQAHSVRVGTCWIWGGQRTSGSRRGGAYPVIRVKGSKNRAQLHRLIIESKMGAPLGTQAAHHQCGNSLCVNPDHLQPVTDRDNIAEMLQRSAFVSRIAELETALRCIDPDHPALERIPLSA